MILLWDGCDGTWTFHYVTFSLNPEFVSYSWSVCGTRRYNVLVRTCNLHSISVIYIRYCQHISGVDVYTTAYFKIISTIAKVDEGVKSRFEGSRCAWLIFRLIMHLHCLEIEGKPVSVVTLKQYRHFFTSKCSWMGKFIHWAPYKLLLINQTKIK